jgi:hypothetical protein
MKKKIDSLSSSKGAAKAEEQPQEQKVTAPVAEDTATKTEEAAATPAAENVQVTPSPSTATSDESFENLFPEPTPSLGAPPSWLWWLVLLIISIILGVVGYALAQQNLRSWLSIEPSPSPTATAEPTPDPNETPEPTPEPTPTPTASPATVDISAVTLRVLNGTTTAGAAARMRQQLERAGFTVRTTGNARNQNYATTIIYYQTGRQAEAEAVRDAIGGQNVNIEQSSLADPDMVLVVIGRN